MVYATEWYVTRGRHFCYSERTDTTRGYTCVPSSSDCASLWGDVSLGALLRPELVTAGFMRGTLGLCKGPEGNPGLVLSGSRNAPELLCVRGSPLSSRHGESMPAVG